jgi:hypothetical protein
VCRVLLVKLEVERFAQHPADVRWAAAFGDSITAAFAARATLLEDRDISWSIGEGNAEQITLPWLMAQYSGGVNGTSTKAVIPNGVTHLPKGALSSWHGMPKAQTAPGCRGLPSEDG